ncbi:protein translocase subunit SecF [Candidatus Woesearchaeota archaeon]|nr:protein translocase subunit SecF [Candidatus Woesearchaeota archaeon]
MARNKGRRVKRRVLTSSTQTKKPEDTIKTVHKPADIQKTKQGPAINDSFLSKLDSFYNQNYKILLLIPAIMLFGALILIFFQVANTGDFINKGVSLKGGTTIEVIGGLEVDALALKSLLITQFENSDIDVRLIREAGNYKGFIIDLASELDSDKVISFLQVRQFLTTQEYSVQQIGSALGENFFRETFRVLIFTFIFMGLVVFFYFRTFIPSLAVILAAASDMIVTVAIINLMGIKLSTAGIAAFLMLIGYSVDTDILLSTRMLKRKTGSAYDGLKSALGTGLLMSITTISAVSAGLYFSQSDVLKQIMLILLVGLLVDIINTWIQNAGILRWYMEAKKID